MWLLKATITFTSSYSEKGGVAIYAKDKLNSLERADLNIKNFDFESTWLEIKNKNSKNIICGCIYRHPCHNLSEFLQYLEKCLKIIAKENRGVCGDFNIDLLKIESINSIQEYYNLLCSYGLLPQIIQPTRVVENPSPSLTDNIFTNIISEEITGGNIYLTLSEHFSEFISIKREKIDYKSESVFTRDYGNFSSESFQDDISIQNWNNRYDINDQFNDFHWRLDECINRHAPFKKTLSWGNKIKM